MEQTQDTPQNQSTDGLNELNQTQSQQPKQPKQPKEKKQKQETCKVDENEYNEYTSLKFLELSGAKLRDETTKRIAELEAKLKACEGSRPVLTVRAAIKNEQVLLVAGIPIPDSILEIIVNDGHSKYYLGE